MTERHHYRLVKVEAQDDAPTFATAAVLTCCACGSVIAGMGGPGADEVCADCGDEILSRRGRALLRGTELDQALLKAIHDWKAPYEAAAMVGRGVTPAQAEAALKALVERGLARYGRSQNTYRATSPD